MISEQTRSAFVEGKPVRTFPDHALANSSVGAAPAAPAPDKNREQRDRKSCRDRFRSETPAGPVDGARPQRGRLAGARQTERDHAVADRGARLGMTTGA